MLEKGINCYEESTVQYIEAKKLFEKAQQIKAQSKLGEQLWEFENSKFLEGKNERVDNAKFENSKQMKRCFECGSLEDSKNMVPCQKCQTFVHLYCIQPPIRFSDVSPKLIHLLFF